MSTHSFEKPVLTIDSAALAGNYRLFAEMGRAAVGGVIKADGYGLGLEPVMDTLLAAGCETFFVATPDEGAAARSRSPSAQIAVLGGLYRGAGEFYLEHQIVPVINSLEELSRWRDFSRARDMALPYWLHIDTGMNRLGLGADEIEKFIADPDQAAPLHLIGVMSHFACSDEKNHPMNQKQADLFAQIATHFPDALKSLCNSSGCFRNQTWHYDLLRPGYALYGGNPTPETKNPMQPVVTLDVPVLQTRPVKKNESIGYGASHVFDGDTQTATLAIGYADGFLRTGSNRAQVYYKGQACPVLGRVSMDLISVGIGHLADRPAPGDKVEIIGPHQSIDDLATFEDTIGYEILTALGGRFARIWA